MVSRELKSSSQRETQRDREKERWGRVKEWSKGILENINLLFQIYVFLIKNVHKSITILKW
jgi:hypothetical protein